jgi:hypothetical protein
MTLLQLSSLKRSLSEIEESCSKRLKAGEEIGNGSTVKEQSNLESIMMPNSKRKLQDDQEPSKRPKLDFVVEKLKSLSLSPVENNLQLVVHVKPISISLPPLLASFLTVEDVTEEFEKERQLVKYKKPIYQ